MINPLNNAGRPNVAAGPASSPGASPADSRQNQLRTAAQAFEAVFLRQLIGSMRSAKLADDPFGSQASEQFRDMSDARLADQMSHQGSFGIAQMLLNQFQRHQAPTATPATPATPASSTGEAGQ
jgi:peptidoglycan hydrolase FlgJ